MAKRVRKTVSKDGILHSYRRVVKSGHSLTVSLPVEWAKEHGIEQWLEEQDRAARCPQCGKKVYWFSRVCSSCHANVR